MSEVVKYYQHATEIPLRNYLEVVINKNLSALTISGFPTPDQLNEAWSQIRSEDDDLDDGMENRVYWQLFKEVTILAMDIETVEICYNLLKVVYVESFANQLLELAEASFTLDPSDQEKYQADLQRCVNRSKTLVVKHGIKKERLDAMGKQEEDKPNLSFEYYQQILIVLSDHAKYEITDSITLFSFRERIKRWNKYCEQLVRNNGGK